MRERQSFGFTMVELLIAVGILGIVVAGVMESFVVQNNAYTVVDQTTETQQNIRAVAHLIERDLRMTGFMVPEGGVVCAVDATNASDTLYVTDADAIDPAGLGNANLGAVITGGYNGNAATLAVQVDDLTLDDRPYYDALNNDGVPDSDFRVGGAAIVMDRANPQRGTACGTVTDVAANRVTVDFETSLGVAGTEAILIPAHRYALTDPLNGVDDDANGIVDDSTLTRNGTPLVVDVDDLQLAFAIDSNEDGTLDDATEYFGNGSANDYLARNTDHRVLREVRFNVVMRSRMDDRDWDEGFQQARENRAAVGATDGYRRRVFTSTVKPRNLGFRGSDQS
jgi:prepilin-type N-terminal cleavage/methylation domain-containing protein